MKWKGRRWGTNTKEVWKLLTKTGARGKHVIRFDAQECKVKTGSSFCSMNSAEFQQKLEYCDRLKYFVITDGWQVWNNIFLFWRSMSYFQNIKSPWSSYYKRRLLLESVQTLFQTRNKILRSQRKWKWKLDSLLLSIWFSDFPSWFQISNN